LPITEDNVSHWWPSSTSQEGESVALTPAAVENVHDEGGRRVGAAPGSVEQEVMQPTVWRTAAGQTRRSPRTSEGSLASQLAEQAAAQRALLVDEVLGVKLDLGNIDAQRLRHRTLERSSLGIGVPEVSVMSATPKPRRGHAKPVPHHG
jgi:hypothetical protein